MKIFRRIQKFITDVGGFSRAEANGFIILIIIIFAVIGQGHTLSFLNQVSPPDDNTSDLEEWVAHIEGSIEKKQIKNKIEETTKLSDFNPNEDSEKELTQAGIPEKIARRIVNYRKAGGRFRQKTDLKKIYGLPDTLYSQLEGFIKLKKQLSDDFFLSRSNSTKTSAREIINLKINSATVRELQKIRGIGPKLSNRIVKYRDLIGGFHSFDQLNEVYGLEPEVITELIRVSSISKETVKININETDSINTLTRHPYINYNLAKSIINYRKVHGNFESLESVKEIKILNDSLFQKIAPYLSL